MKKIHGIKILFESEQRKIGRNPLDFLQTTHIQNGQFVSVGYLNEQKLSLKKRYVNAQNDAALNDIILKSGDTKFSRDWDRLRRNANYQDVLAGKSKRETVDFEFDSPIHIVKLGRYNFQWKNNESKNRHYETREIPMLHAIRKHYGFDNIPDIDDETNWRNKRDKNGKLLYGGSGVMPRINASDENSGLGWKPIGGEGADFYQHENTHNISFRQILRKSNMAQYQFYYIQESDGLFEPIDKDTYTFLSSAFSKEKIVDTCDDLLDEEKAFIQDMEEFAHVFEHKTFDWKKIMYLTGSTVGADSESGKKIYEPFIWINDEVLMETYPWMDDDDLARLIEESIRISQKDLKEWKNTPQMWESKKFKYSKKLNESLGDGWNGEEELYDLKDVLSNIYNLSYEIENCYRGAYTNCKTYSQLGDYILNLANELAYQGEYIKNLDGPVD